jgi:hypothetical protein
VAEDHGSPGAEEIEVAVAVGVEEVGAPGMGEEGRVTSYSAEGADRRVNASGEEFFGPEL